MPLFKTQTGVPIPSEIGLLIIENLDYEPGMLENIMCISPEFEQLVKTHEVSLCARFAAILDLPIQPIRAARLALDHPVLHPLTFRWLCESHFRKHMLQNLKTDGFCSGMHRIYRRTGFCIRCFDKTIGGEKFIGMNLLLRIFDANLENCSRREAQESYIVGLNAIELAQVRLLTFSLASKYTMDLLNEEDFNGEEAYDTASMEMSCIVREMVLRNGPYFLWADRRGTQAEKALVATCIRDGIVQLRVLENWVFESLLRQPSGASCALKESENPFVAAIRIGHSLESIIVQEFCTRAGIVDANYWDPMVDVAVQGFLDRFPGPVHAGSGH